MTILDAIVATKNVELSSLPSITPKHSLGPSFIDAIMSVHPALIAEIKPKSPSSGPLLSREDVPRLVHVYDKYAQAMSVLCDEQYFGGGFDLLAQVRSLTKKPLLAKEFIISTRQIDHAANEGANAILLIAAILDVNALQEFASYAIHLNLDVLIEIHTEEEVKRAAEAFDSLTEKQREHVLLGINNRNLHTLTTDLGITEKLAPFIRERIPGIRGIIAESGIQGRGDIERLANVVEGFLIGTSIARAPNPDEYLQSLFVPNPKIKFCGMTRSEDIAVAEALGVDFVGFVFVPSSPRTVSFEKVKELRSSIISAKVVGVFADESVDQIERFAKELSLDFMQLHGKPNMELVKVLSTPVIQAFRGVPDVATAEKFLQCCPYILIDKADGEVGADFEAIAALPSSIRKKLFVAGGLTPKNVRMAVEHVQPFAVDCARGIESEPGIKNHRLMHDFFSAFR